MYWAIVFYFLTGVMAISATNAVTRPRGRTVPTVMHSWTCRALLVREADVFEEHILDGTIEAPFLLFLWSF